MPLTRAGVGRSSSRQSRVAGRDAAAQALACLEGARPHLALVFATAGHDQAALLTGVCEQVPADIVSGCSAEGVIGAWGSDEGSHAVGVMMVASDEMKFQCLLAPNVGAAPRAAAAGLAAQLKGRLNPHGVLLLFPDGLTTDCTELLAGLRDQLPPGVTVVGGTAGELLVFEKTYQYRGREAASDAVAAVWVEGAIADVAVSHGCDLVGLERTITRAREAMVYEIDGQPAWQFFRDYLNAEVDHLDAMTVAHLCLAERLPAGLDADYGSCIIRVPLRLDANTGALFFPGGLREGTRVQMALRNPVRVVERAMHSARQVALRHPGEKPSLVLQFDCAGRGRLLFGEQANEACVTPMQKAMGSDVPWLGLHTYGEIAPVGAQCFFHNHTVALCALYPRRPAAAS